MLSSGSYISGSYVGPTGGAILPASAYQSTANLKNASSAVWIMATVDI